MQGVKPGAVVLSAFYAFSAYSQPVQLVNAFPNLSFNQPVFLSHSYDGTDRIFVVQQDGIIKVFPNDSAVTSSSASTFLNISNKLSSSGGEEGLLGLAFHPDYAANGYFYVNYTAPTPLRTVVARYSVMPGNPNKADSLSELKIVEINQPYSNHNGGMIFFGTDGYLYIAMGDGGSGGDPQNRAQNLQSLLGKILRIDVDTSVGPRNYGIPPTNPFYGNPTAGREELYAWGLRNPWRVSQDPVTGLIWGGDVGQGAWEEIDTLSIGRNYGWRCYEGNALYDTTGCGPASNYIFPLVVYSHGFGCSVTGGYVYRGYRRPDLAGKYIYGDYCSGRIWSYELQGGQVTTLIDAPFLITSFGVDQYNELYICNYSLGNIQRFAGGPLLPTTTLVFPGNNSQNVPLPVTLRWRQEVTATQYWLEIDDDAGFSSLVVQDSTLTDTSFFAAGLDSGTQYYWRVRVKNLLGWGAFTSAWNFTTVVAPPPAPLLSLPPDGAVDQPTTLMLVWNQSTGADFYRLQVSLDSNFASTLVDDSTLVGTQRQVGPLADSTTHYWRVNARNTGGTSPWSTPWRFTTVDLVSRQYAVTAGWNMISVPLIVEDARKAVVFPTSTSNAFAYAQASGYLPKDTLENGTGYWLKFGSPQNVSVTGVPLLHDTVGLVAGWNMIGSVTNAVDTGSIVQVPPGIVQSLYYRYSGTYSASDTIHPAKAYWVKASAPGQLILGSGQPGPTADQGKPTGGPPDESGEAASTKKR